MLDDQFDREEIEKALPDFKFVSRLGKGAFATVFLVEERATGDRFALKKISMFGLGEYEKKNCLNEVRLMSSLRHETLLEFHSSRFDSVEDDLYIFMEHAAEGDLSALVELAQSLTKRINEALVWRVVVSVLEGLTFLHSNGIIHRDIKPANILKSNGRFKLTDMNVAKIVKNGEFAKTQIGTPYYTSPQVWSNNGCYDAKCDVWSLGVIIYELCNKKVPFDAHSTDELIEKIRTTKIKKLPDYYSEDLNRLMHLLLTPDASKRPSAAEALKYCANCGKFKEVDMSGVFKAESNLLDTILMPEGGERWVNLAPPLPRRSSMECKSTQGKGYETSRNNSREGKPRNLITNSQKDILGGQPSEQRASGGGENANTNILLMLNSNFPPSPYPNGTPPQNPFRRQSINQSSPGGQPLDSNNLQNRSSLMIPRPRKVPFGIRLPEIPRNSSIERRQRENTPSKLQRRELSSSRITRKQAEQQLGMMRKKSEGDYR